MTQSGLHDQPETPTLGGSSSGGLEPLPDVGPLRWRFSSMFAHGGLMADEQFMNVAGASLPIALCGLTRLPRDPSVATLPDITIAEA